MTADLLRVPYGTDVWPPRHGTDVQVPCERIDRSGNAPLRFNNGDYAFAALPGFQASANPWETVTDYLSGLCRAWDRSSSDFIAAYFGFVDMQIETNKGLLNERLSKFSGLYNYRDWIFSAPKPLPRAHLPLGGQDEFVMTDFAFWTGRKFIAVDTAPQRLLPDKARERAARLEAAGIDHIDLNGRRAGEDMFHRILDALPQPFWEGQAFPMGPIRSNVLDSLGV